MPNQGITSAPERIVTIQRDLKTLLDDIQGRFQVDLGVEVNLSGTWFQDVPKLARTCADIQEVLKAYFETADFTPDDLRALEEAVRQMDELIAYIDGAMSTMRRIHASMRKQLCDRTQSIVDQVDALRRMPFLPKEQKSEVERFSVPIDKILADRQAGRDATRLNNERLRLQGADEAAAAETRLAMAQQENAVLRGESLAVPAPPRAARQVRRPRAPGRSPRTRK